MATQKNVQKKNAQLQDAQNQNANKDAQRNVLKKNVSRALKKLAQNVVLKDAVAAQKAKETVTVLKK